LLSVSIDETPLGRIRTGTYLYAALEPAQYTLTSQSERARPVALVVEAGKNYFFLQEFGMGWLEARSQLIPMDEATGRAGVLATELASSQPPPRPRPRVGCSKDTDCKGDRVCTAGACVDAAPR
jgi:hypothetical protein